MKRIIIYIIIIIVLFTLKGNASNPELSFYGEIGSVDLYSDDSFINFDDGNVYGYFSEIRYYNVDNIKVNNTLMQNETMVIIKMNENSSSKEFYFENLTLNLPLENLSFEKKSSKLYIFTGETEFTKFIDFEPKHEKFVYFPREYEFIKIDNYPVDSNIEFDINENTQIFIDGKVELDIHAPSKFDLTSYNANNILIKGSTGDLRYKTYRFRVINTDFLEIIKYNNKKINKIEVEIRNNEISIHGDVDKVELSNNIITKSDFLYLIADNIPYILTILNILVLCYLACLTSKYAKSTAELVKFSSDQTKIMKLNLEENTKETEQSQKQKITDEIIGVCINKLNKYKDRYENYNNFTIDQLRCEELFTFRFNDRYKLYYQLLVNDFPEFDKLVINYEKYCELQKKDLAKLKNLIGKSDSINLIVNQLYDNYKENEEVIEILNTITKDSKLEILEKFNKLLKISKSMKNDYIKKYHINH